MEDLFSDEGQNIFWISFLFYWVLLLEKKNTYRFLFFKRKKDIHLSGCIMSSPLLLPFRLLLWLPMKPNNPPPKMWEKISSMPPPPPLPSRRPCSPYLSYNSRFSGFDRTSYAKLISLNYKEKGKQLDFQKEEWRKATGIQNPLNSKSYIQLP